MPFPGSPDLGVQSVPEIEYVPVTLRFCGSVYVSVKFEVMDVRPATNSDSWSVWTVYCALTTWVSKLLLRLFNVWATHLVGIRVDILEDGVLRGDRDLISLSPAVRVGWPNPRLVASLVPGALAVIVPLREWRSCNKSSCRQQSGDSRRAHDGS